MEKHAEHWVLSALCPGSLHRSETTDMKDMGNVGDRKQEKKRQFPARNQFLISNLQLIDSFSCKKHADSLTVLLSLPPGYYEGKTNYTADDSLDMLFGLLKIQFIVCLKPPRKNSNISPNLLSGQVLLALSYKLAARA